MPSLNLQFALLIKENGYILRASNSAMFIFAFLFNRDKFLKEKDCFSRGANLQVLKGKNLLL